MDEVKNARQNMTRRQAVLFGRRALAWSMAALCGAPMVAQAAGISSDLTVSDPWIRTVGGPAPAAGYFTLSNASGTPEILAGVSSPDCGKLTMHESRNVNGVESMVMVVQRPVPPHGRIVFAPGSFHLMCMSPSRAVRPGAQIPVVLRFADGRRLQVRFPVRPIGGG
jgi:copper(I)-binding protein